jgi:LytS/YehU family sensor histidine kinase
MVVSKTVLGLLGFLCSLVLWRIYRRVIATNPSIVRIVVVAVIASYVLALVWTAGDTLTDIPIAARLLGREIRIRSVAQLFNGAVYNSFTLLAWSVLYFGIRHHEAWRVERERSLQAEAMAQQARLEALRYQLQPHFLFNTLNAISTLVVERRAEDAGRMISRLSDFLRLTLTAPVTERIPLADELDFIGRYLEIEQVRFGNRLAVAIDAGPETLSALVPSMILQPVVENAIRHGVAARERGGSIAIQARRAGDRVQLTVSDDGPGSRGKGEGIGLSNTRERLTRLYDGRHRLDLASTAEGTRVLIELPWSTAAG